MNPNKPKKPGVPLTKKSYDLIFKEILETSSSSAVVAFLNSVFKHTMPPDSAVEPLRTESNAGSLTTSDYILKVTEPGGASRYFHIEAQTTNDRNMAFRMVEYGIRFALGRAKDSKKKNRILVEFPSAAVFYLKDTRSTPRTLTVTIRSPDGRDFSYDIPTERISDYTPAEMLEQGKFPLFPFHMANYRKKDADRYEREWLEGCAKLEEFVNSGRMERADAERLMDEGAVVIRKSNHPNKEEVLSRMDMYKTIGVGVDWLEIKRQKDEAAAQGVAQGVEQGVAQGAAQAKEATAKKALAAGLAPALVAEIVDLPLAEVEALAKSASAPDGRKAQ